MTNIGNPAYQQLADNALSVIDSFQEMGFRFGDLEHIRQAVRTGEPLTVMEREYWDEILKFLVRFARQPQRELLFSLKFFYDQAITPHRAELTRLNIIALDPENRSAIALDEQIKVATRITPINTKSVKEVVTEEGELFFRFKYDDRLWVVMNPLAESENISGPIGSKSISYVTAYEATNDSTHVGQLYTTVLLHHILKKYKLYNPRLANDLTVEKVRFVDHVFPDTWPAYLSTGRPLHAYSFAPLNNNGWEPLVTSVPVETNDEEKEFHLNPALNGDLARKALREIQIMANMLKQMGIVMNSWEHVRVNMKTGKVSLGIEDRPLLMDANRLSNILNEYSRIVPISYYFPNLTAYAHPNENMSLSERELKLIIDLLSLKSLELPDDLNLRGKGLGLNEAFQLIKQSIPSSSDQFADLALEEFDRYIETVYRNDMELMETVQNAQAQLHTIFKYYYEILNEEGEGIFIFSTEVLPLILERFETDEIAELTLAYIDQASIIQRNDFSVEEYWRKKANYLENLDIADILGGNNNGSPTENSPTGGLGGGGGLTSGSGGPVLGQAKQASINEFVTTVMPGKITIMPQTAPMMLVGGSNITFLGGLRMINSARIIRPLSTLGRLPAAI